MKKHTLTLDIELDDESPLLDDIAILFFHTDTPNYLFADDLNHLYRLALTRVDDIPLSDDDWPLYTYHDQMRLFNYYLVERPLTATKILIIRGEDASDESDKILHDFSTTPADADPLRPDMLQRNDLLNAYQQALTTVTTYNSQSPSPLSHKEAKERQEIENLLTNLIDYLDLNHL